MLRHRFLAVTCSDHSSAICLLRAKMFPSSTQTEIAFKCRPSANSLLIIGRMQARSELSSNVVFTISVLEYTSHHHVSPHQYFFLKCSLLLIFSLLIRENLCKGLIRCENISCEMDNGFRHSSVLFYGPQARPAPGGPRRQSADGVRGPGHNPARSRVTTSQAGCGG